MIHGEKDNQNLIRRRTRKRSRGGVPPTFPKGEGFIGFAKNVTKTVRSTNLPLWGRWQPQADG